MRLWLFLLITLSVVFISQSISLYFLKTPRLYHIAEAKEDITYILALEGGIANHPMDRGGTTYYGLSTKFSGAKQSYTKEEAYQWYEDLWMQHKLYRVLNVAIRLYVFDMIVHHGAVGTLTIINDARQLHYGQARFSSLEEALKYATALSCTDSKVLVDMRRAYTYNIIKRDSSQRVFLKGWLHRIEKLRC